MYYDFGSPLGSYVNGIKVEYANLQFGDEICVGQHIYRLVSRPRGLFRRVTVGIRKRSIAAKKSNQHSTRHGEGVHKEKRRTAPAVLQGGKPKTNASRRASIS